MDDFTYNLAKQMVDANNTTTYQYDGHNRRVSVTKNNRKTYSFYNQQGQLVYRKTPAGELSYIFMGAKLVAKDGFIDESSSSSKTHYKPFGDTIEAAKDDVGYTGHKFDADLHLNYMQARYYDPVIGRFYGNDPVGFRDIHSFNRYAYANNNPYKYIDPDGQAPKTKSGGLKGRMANVAKSACKEACGSLIFYADPETQADYAMRGNTRRAALRQAKRDAKVPNAQNPEKVDKVNLTDKNKKVIKDENGNIVKSTEYTHTTTDGKKVVIQDHSAGHDNGGVGDQGSHFNVRPIENTRTGKVEGTEEHYEFDKK